MLLSSVYNREADNNIDESFYKFSVSEVQGIHRMVTLNILGDHSGHGRNGGGERHIWRIRRRRSVGECCLFSQHHASRRRYQHCATNVAYPGAVSAGVYFDNYQLCNSQN